MKTLLCIGDSNTHGTMPMRDMGDRRRFDRATRWPGVTAAALGPEWHVIEEGQPGRTTVHDDPIEGPHRNGLRMLPGLLETHRPVDVLALMLGTNDLRAIYSATALDIALGVDRMIRMILEADNGTAYAPPEVLVISPVPIIERAWLGELFVGKTETSEVLGGYLRQVAKANGASFLDAGAVAEVDPEEGVHLTATGHARLGREVAQSVRTIEHNR